MKKLFVILTILIIAAGSSAVLILKPWEQKPAEQSVTEQSAAEQTQPKVDKIKEKLASMTLDEKVSQLIIAQAPRVTALQTTGSEATGQSGTTTTEKLETAPYGGYILMSDNFRTLARTREFIEKLQEKAKTPLIIMTDEEGGSVQRIQNITNRTPTDIPFMSQVSSPEKAKTIGCVMAEELRTLGINVDTAPDADVYSNPYNTVIGQRSFSSDPEIVAKMSEALASGLEENGVMSVYKHFPGHGNTATDSHSSLPIIESTNRSTAF